MEIVSNLGPNIFWLKVRTHRLSTLTFVRTFSQFTKKQRKWKINISRPRYILEIGGIPVYFHFPLVTLARFAERAVPEVAEAFDLKGDGVKPAAVALAVKTAMIAHREASVRSHLIKEEGDAYLLVILYCWQTGLFVPDQALFPYTFDEIMTAFSQQSKIDLSIVETTFSHGEH